MTSLQLAVKARATVSANPSARLYRSIIKELPRVLTIYDIDMPLEEAKDNIRSKFDQYANIKDDRVKGMLVEKGYMELEETLLQHKQRGHLLRTFAGYIEPKGSSRKRLGVEPSIDEQFARSY